MLYDVASAARGAYTLLRHFSVMCSTWQNIVLGVIYATLTQLSTPFPSMTSPPSVHTMPVPVHFPSTAAPSPTELRSITTDSGPVILPVAAHGLS